MILLFIIPIGVQFFYHINELSQQKKILSQQIKTINSNKNLILLIKKIAEYRRINQDYVYVKETFKNRIIPLEEEINKLFNETQKQSIRRN